MQRRARLALILGVALMAGPQSSARPLPPATHDATLRLTSDNPAFGGLSGVEIAADGARFLALGDKGTLVEGRIERDETGRALGAVVESITLLQDAKGHNLARPRNDAEGMDLAADGSLLVSFEGRPTRIWIYRNGKPQGLKGPKAFGRFGLNAGIEAVARDAEGTIYAIPEGSASTETPFTLFRYRHGKWDNTLTVPQRGAFLPVAADVGPDDRLYLLERKFISPLGFASRLRRFGLSDQGLTEEETLLETTLGVHDNLEGLSVWRDTRGSLRASMVSDDNLMWFLKTDLVEYRLPD